MCGIFGVVLKPGAAFSELKLRQLLERLYHFSESRGKESTGLSIYLPETAHTWTVKSAKAASDVFHSKPFQETLKTGLSGAYGENKSISQQGVVVLAHSRLVTNGRAELPQNNQPVKWGNVNIVHNGIIVNVEHIWSENPTLERFAEVDTEVLAAVLNDRMLSDFNPIAATKFVYQQIEGSASIAWVHSFFSGLTLATNTGDLYYAALPQDKGLVFASERFILESALKGTIDNPTVLPIRAGTGVFYNMTAQSSLQSFDLTAVDEVSSHPLPDKTNTPIHHEIAMPVTQVNQPIIKIEDESLLKYNDKSMREIRRCTKCVLPETFPFIHFDETGSCNYCQNYKTKYKGIDAEQAKHEFIQMVQQYKTTNGSADVLVPFSGGRDSCYGLHLIKHEFGLNPVTFTYDWGMVTDLARRNIARLTGKLGVQNILVSADIKMKRANIKKNVAAWLKQPDLGMVPLFMAGDKHFFKIANDIKRQTGIRLDLWSANPLENTDFKSGFCGTPPDFEKKRVDYQSVTRKLRMVGYYASRFLMNPAYINSSLIDTAKAFSSYYFEPRRDFFFMFDHMVWDEKEVNNVIINQYDFETSPDSTSTWRIGDGTAPFYNYIYMTSRGFTEFDTFRSNQIREGQITRAEALEAILVENQPRVESLRWYLDVLGLDFNQTIKTVNRMDKLGLHQ